MADNESHKKLPDKKLYNPRKNPALRHPPGVQKALQNFGVPDLREWLGKKHKGPGSSPEDKPLDPRKQPPPDPSYNYLKDPSRELPGSSSKSDEAPQRQSNQRKLRSHQQNNNNNTNESYSDSKDNYSERGTKDTVKKELRFSDSPQVLEGALQISGRGRGSFRGHNPRGRGRHVVPKVREVIENPVNIKVQLRVDSGQRSCTLDEGTKIAEIKHVPDWTSGGQKPHRGNFRSGRGSFRRGKRGRGNFHEERPTNDNKTDEKHEAATLTVNNTSSDIQPAVEENRQDSFEQEEYVDSSENYEEFSSEYQQDECPEPFKSSSELEENLVQSNF